MFSNKSDKKNNPNKTIEMQPLLFDDEEEIDEIPPLESEDELDADRAPEADEFVAEPIDKLSYRLQVIALLQNIVNHSSYAVESDLLMSRLRNGLVRHFFEQIASYYAVKKKLSDRTINSLNAKNTLKNIQNQIERLLAPAMVFDEPNIAEIKTYLLAYYYLYLPVKNNRLVFKTEENDRSYLARQEQAKSFLQALMEKNFPLAFHAYTACIQDKEQHFTYHMQGAACLAPASQAELGQDYLSYLKSAVASPSITPYPHEKEINVEEALLALRQAAQQGNRHAISYIAIFLENYCHTKKRLLSDSAPIITPQQNDALQKMALAILSIRPQNEEIKRALNTLALAPSNEEKQVAVDCILKYLNEEQAGYVAEMRVNPETLTKLAKRYAREVSNIERVQLIITMVRQLCLARINKKYADYLNQLLVAMNERMAVFNLYGAVDINQAELAAAENALSLMQEEMLQLNQERNKVFIEVIRDKIKQLEANADSANAATLDLQYKIICDFEYFYSTHISNSNEVEKFPQEIIADWKKWYMMDGEPNPFQQLVGLPPATQPNRSAFFSALPSQDPIYQLFIDYVDGDTDFLLACPEENEENEENEDEESNRKCYCVLS